MNLIILLISSAFILILAYFTYGKYVAVKLKINNKNITPAHTLEDGIDYIPSKTAFARRKKNRRPVILRGRLQRRLEPVRGGGLEGSY
jgi:hypothetical protein